MARVSLEEFMPNPVVVGGDESWKPRRIFLRDHLADPLGFLAGYVRGLIEYSCDFEGKRPGKVVFLCGRTWMDMYALLDSEIKAHKEPYVLYGVLVISGYRVSFYKWERRHTGAVTKTSCEAEYYFTRPEEVCDIIGPTIRGMLNEVSDHEDDLKFLEAGKDVKLHALADMWDPAWSSTEYPKQPLTMLALSN